MEAREKARGASGRVSAAGTLRTPSYWRNAILIIIIVDLIFVEKLIIIMINCVNAVTELFLRSAYITRDHLD